MKNLAFFLLACALCALDTTGILAQPANDNCASAALLSVGTTCTPAPWTSVGSTAEATSVAANPTCGFYQGGDVWFTFQSPASGNFRIDLSGVSAGSAQWVLYSGTCSSFTEVLCSSNARNFSDPTLGSLVYYLRVFRTNSSLGNDFNLCVSETTPPGNNHCVNATPLAVGQTCASQPFSSQFATAEATTVAVNPTCGFYQGGDVWFSFQSPASGNFRIDLSGVSSGSAQWVLYSGTCGSFTEVLCSSNARNFSDPGLGGQDYYLRVFRTNSDQGNDFNLCIWEMTPPPNNSCVNATSLTVGQACIPVPFTSQFATAEATTVAVNPTCGFYQGGDVWFSFQSPASGNFRIDLSGVSAGSAQWVLYSGTCGSFTEVLCSSNARNFSDPALGSQNFYLRVFRTNSDQGNDFNLCIWEISPPVNNNCANATTIELDFECIPMAYSSQFATAEPVAVTPNPTCGFYQGGDVWFKFVVPLSGNFRIESSGVGVGTINWVLYSGNCGNFTEVFCTGTNTTFVEPALANQTLYLRAFRTNSDQGNDFSLCIFETLEPPVNDFCADAIDLSVGVSCIPLAFSSQVATAEPTSVASNPSCGFYQGGDVWFTFDVPLSGNFRIEIANLSTGSANFVAYSGTCGNFTELACASANANVSRPDLAGQTLYLRLHRVNSIQGNDFTLCVWETEPPLNDFCSNATELDITDQCSTIEGSTKFTTAENTDVASNPTCGFYQGGDVWYRFTAPLDGAFTVENIASSAGSNAATVYAGACGNFVQIGCLSGNTSLDFNADTLEGQDIFLRFYRVNSNQGADFTFCVSATAQPENDECLDYIPLTLESNCTPVMYNNLNATSDSDNDPSCGNFQGNDVWFRFAVPESGQFVIIREDLGDVPMAMAIGTNCTATSEEICTTEPQLIFNNPNSFGQQYFLRVYSNGTEVGTLFSLCVVEGDCNGDVDGTAFFDECDICVGGNTGLEACSADCNGVLGGTAYNDACGDCVGGNTGQTPCVICDVVGGTMSTPDPVQNLCIGDGQPNVINLSVADNVGVGRFGLVIPGSLDVVASNATGVFDMENYPAGNYQIRHVSVNDISDLQGITNGSQLSGCFDLSNTINVSSFLLSGGVLTANGPTTLCGGTLGFSVTGSLGPNQRFVLLNFDATEVLDYNTSGSFNLDNYNPGSYRVVHIAYSNSVNLGSLTPPTIPECMDASNQVAVTVQSCASLTSSPNPTTGPSQVTFNVSEAGPATLEIYDLSGRKVRSLFSAQAEAHRDYRVNFDASELPNGIYLYRLNTSREVITDKFILAL